MNKEQRKNTVKYLYDISKGVALISVIENFLKDKWELSTIILGIVTAILPLAAKAGGFAHHAMRKRLFSSETS